MADLLKEGKEDRARLRVKHVIRDDFLSEALEIIYSYVDDVLKSISVIQGSKYTQQSSSSIVLGNANLN